MKKAYMKIRLITIVTALFSLVLSLQTNAQCEKKDLCENDGEEDIFGWYDFRSQSAYAKLSPGDTSSVALVLYGNQRYRIFVCADSKLGDVIWTVNNPERKTKRTIQSIKRDTIKNYKMEPNPDDPEGAQLISKDKSGKDIILSKTIIADTLWNTERISVDKVVFGNKKNPDKLYYEFAPKKSERFTIKVSIPNGDANYSGCVNIYVGRLPLDAKNFSKEGKYKTNETY